jgi:hypothetical protein
MPTKCAFKHILEPADPDDAMRVLWLDDDPSVAGDLLPRTVEKLGGRFDIRFCTTAGAMRDLAVRRKWAPDVILADWDIASSFTEETDATAQKISQTPGAGMTNAVILASELWRRGHYSRVISCSSWVNSSLREMVLQRSDVTAAAGVAIQMERDLIPGIVDLESGGLKGMLSDTYLVLGIVARSYRGGLLVLAERGELTGPGYSEWSRLCELSSAAPDIDSLRRVLEGCEGLRVNDPDRESHGIPAVALFADVYFGHGRDFPVDKSLVAEFCMAANAGKWQALVQETEEVVRSAFDDFLNTWPVRLLRDGGLSDPGEIQALAALVEPSVYEAHLDAKLPARADPDRVTCAIAMLVVLEACQRVRLRAAGNRLAVLKQCVDALARHEQEVGRTVDTVVVDLQRSAGQDGRGVEADPFTSDDQDEAPRGNLFPRCWEKWGRPIDLDDVTRLMWPVHRVEKDGATVVTVPTMNTGAGPGRHLSRKTHWNKNATADETTGIAHMPEFRAAVDRFLVQTAREMGLDPDEVRSRLHPDLVIR